MFSLAGVQLNRKGVQTLAAGLCRNVQLQSLNLSRCRLKDAGCTVLCNALQNSPQSSVRDLNLSRNLLTLESAVSIAALISATEKIEILLLNGNKLGTTGAITLFDALEANTSVKVFYLENNDIYSKVATVLHDVILKNDVLQIVSLSNNSIDEDGAEKMINSIRVKKIMLSTNFFKEYPQKLRPFTSGDWQAKDAKIPEEVDQKTREFNRATLYDLHLDMNELSEKISDDLEYVLRARLMTVFRYIKDKIIWSREAWTIAETEYGPKFLKESIEAMSKRDASRVKFVINQTNRKQQKMVEV